MTISLEDTQNAYMEVSFLPYLEFRLLNPRFSYRNPSFGNRFYGLAAKTHDPVANL